MKRELIKRNIIINGLVEEERSFTKYIQTSARRVEN